MSEIPSIEKICLYCKHYRRYNDSGKLREICWKPSETKKGQGKYVNYEQTCDKWTPREHPKWGE